MIRNKFLPESAYVLYKRQDNPVHNWTGPEDSRRLRLPDFMTCGT